MPELRIADTKPIDFVRRHLAFTATPTTAPYIALDCGRDEASESEDRDG